MKYLLQERIDPVFMATINFSPEQYPIERFGTPNLGLKSRVKKSYTASGTAAYVPSLFLEDIKLPVETIKNYPKINLDLLIKLKSDIENHFERGIQVLLIQLIAVYKTNLILTEQKAQLQIGQGKNANRKKDKYAACHVAKVPSFTCARKNEKAVFGQGTAFDLICNETTFLPKDVNDVDSRLDLHHRKLKTKIALRGFTANVLNLIAPEDSKFDPRFALETFLYFAKTLIKTAKEVDKQKERHFILDCYLRVVDLYQKKVISDDIGLKMLCGRVRWKDPIGHDFYRNVQHEIFICLFEGKGNPPELGLLPVKMPKQITLHLEEKKEEEIPLPKLSGRALDYQILLEKSEKISELVKNYFSKLDKKITDKDSLSFEKLKTSVSAKKAVDWSEPMWEIYRESLQLIRDTYKVKEPQRMGEILAQVVKAH